MIFIGRNLLNSNLNGFGSNSAGSSSSSSSISGSTTGGSAGGSNGGGSSSTLLSSLTSHNNGNSSSSAANQLMNNANSLASLNLQAAKSLLNGNSSSSICTSGNKLADLYGQLLSNNGATVVSRQSNAVHSLVGNSSLGSSGNNSNQSPLGSSSSSAQLTRSSSPLSNNGGNSAGLVNNGNGNGVGTAFPSLYDRDEGIGESPTFDSIAAANLATLSSSLGSIGNSNASSLWPDFGNSTGNTNSSNVQQQASRA